MTNTGTKHKLKIYYKNVMKSKEFKTIDSYDCQKDEITNILAMAKNDRKEDKIKQIVYNGKEIGLPKGGQQ